MFKKIPLSLILAGLFFSATANAKTEALSFNDGFASFSDTFNSSVASAFTDFFTFVVPDSTAGSVAGSVTTSYKLKNKVLSQGVSFTDFSLFNATNQEVATGFPLNGNQSEGLFAENLAAGDYSIKVSGISNFKGAGYSGNVTLEIAPIPEPGEWMLLISGLGMICWTARRRSGRSPTLAV